MKDYKLGDKIICTTQERYENEFKSLGYVPVGENKPTKKEEIKVEKPKSSKPKKILED